MNPTQRVADGPAQSETDEPKEECAEELAWLAGQQRLLGLVSKHVGLWYA